MKKILLKSAIECMEITYNKVIYLPKILIDQNKTIQGQ